MKLPKFDINSFFSDLEKVVLENNISKNDLIKIIKREWNLINTTLDECLSIQDIAINLLKSEIEDCHIKLKVGPTDNYPEGKLEDSDNGEIAMAIDAKNGNVRLHFGTPISWVALPPKTAIELGNKLIEIANQTKSKIK